MPAHQRRWRHQQPDASIGGQEPRESGKQRPIRPRKPWPQRRSAKNGELVTEEHDLRVTIEVATAPSQQPQHRHEAEVEETESHPGIQPMPGWPLQSRIGIKTPFRADRNGRWLAYPPSTPTLDIETLIGAIEQDRSGAFWG